MAAQAPGRWWEGAVLYQVYVRSFADGDGDGYGDLRGLRQRLDYLVELGVDGLWCSPTMPSPDTDWGYDVADYCDVHPELGDLAGLDELLVAADARGLRVLLDLVPNHTSSAHPWFVESRAGREAVRRDWYVWADPAPDGGPPNNWRDATGEPAWTLDQASGQYYLHNFLDTQPDLNWWNPSVATVFEEILRFWFDRGIAGFRIDVAHGLFKDADLRDDPVVDDPADPAARYGLEPRFSMHRPETHGVYRRWRRIAESYEPPRLLLGETWVHDLERLASYLGEDDELQLAFNFPFALAPFEPFALAEIVRRALDALGDGCPVWTASNHDIGRFPTRWAAGDPGRARCGLVLLTMLPGTVVLYYGDELGMIDVEVPPELQRDPMTWRRRGGKPPRDRARTPLAWDDGPGRGFSRPGALPWLPLEAPPAGSVEVQRSEPTSPLRLTRELLALRRRHLSGRVAPYRELALGGDRWSFVVGPLVVAASFATVPLELDGLPPGRIAVSSWPDRVETACSSRLTLAPFEAVVLEPDDPVPSGPAPSR